MKPAWTHTFAALSLTFLSLLVGSVWVAMRRLHNAALCLTPVSVRCYCAKVPAKFAVDDEVSKFATTADYDTLRARPDMPLSDIKIKFLLQCREHHPEIGGNPDHFIKVSEAYSRILRDHGLEMEEGEAFNFGAKASLPDAAEARQLLSEKERRMLEVAVSNRLLLGHDAPKAPEEKPFREKIHIFNLFFRPSRDAPTRPTPDEPDSTMSKEEYQLALKRSDELERRGDVAGSAALTATDAMWSVKEAKQLRIELIVLFTTMVGVISVIIISYSIYRTMLNKHAQQPELRGELSADTLLPWWGNDFEYEKQVKRFFVDEWRKARQSSRRVQTFQEGVAREGMSEEERRALDTTIFEVSGDRLAKLRENVTEIQSVQKDEKPQEHDALMPPLRIPRGVPPGNVPR